MARVFMRSKRRQRRFHYGSQQAAYTCLNEWSVSSSQLFYQDFGWRKENPQKKWTFVPFFPLAVFFPLSHLIVVDVANSTLNLFLIKMSRSLSSAILCFKCAQFAFLFAFLVCNNAVKLSRLIFSMRGIHASNYFLELAFNWELIIPHRPFITSNEWLI